MNSLQVDILMQCSCSGGDGINPILILAVLAGGWLLLNWIKKIIESKEVSIMNKTGKIIIVIVLIAVVGVVIALKQKGKSPSNVPTPATNSQTEAETGTVASNSEPTESLPKLVDLGAGKCIPCKMMAPILEELEKEYAGKLDVVFIDVWENPDEKKGYNIKMIPTQIFYDSSGKELFRHEGFFSKEDILGKWKELGITFEETVSKQPEFDRFKPSQTDTRPKDQ